MRTLVRIAVVLVVLLVALLGTLAVVLPRLAGSEAVRARLRDAVSDAVGYEVGWEDLSFGLLPPRLVVREPRVEGPAGAAAPLARADALSLRVALLPLLARTVVVDSLVVDGGSLRLERTKDGLRLPGAPVPAARRGADREPAAEGNGGLPVALAVRRVRVARARLVVEDRTLAPPLTWEMTDVDARATGTSIDAPLDLDVSARLATGGTVRTTGTAGLDGRIDLTVRLDDVDVGPLGRYAGLDEPARGLVSGSVAARGAAAALEALEADLTMEDADLGLAGGRLRGRSRLEARVAGPPVAPTGTVEVDATQAELVWGDAFAKPAGVPATVAGRLVAGPDGAPGLEDARVRLRNLDGTLRASLGRRPRVELDVPPFAVDGWEALVPALTPLRPTGSVALESLGVATAPPDLRGRILLDDLRLRPEDREPLRLDGRLEGTGGGLRSTDLRATIADQTAALDLEVSALLTAAPRYRLGARVEKADANALVTALAGKPDVLHGPTDLTADLSGPLGGPRPPLETVGGRAHLAVGQGRLKGVSLLRSAFERLGALGEAALLAGALHGGRDLQRFYDDEFQSITGTFELGAGQARTDDLHLVYRHYTTDLRGTLGLVDGTLDSTGQLTIDDQVDAAIAQAAEPEGGRPVGRRKTIPLARVRGTLAAPRVDVTPEAAVAFAASFALGRRGRKLERKIDEHLGEGTGRAIFDTLEGILGGRRRPEPAR